MLKKYPGWIILGMMIIGIAFQATGCGYFTSPTAIEALTKEDQVDTFYGEGKGNIYIDNKLVQKYDFREWKGQDKDYFVRADIRTEEEFFKQYYGEEEITPSMRDGDWILMREEDTFNDSELVVYVAHKNQYSIKSMSLADEVTGNIRTGINSVLENGSLKNYVMEIITQLEGEYNFSIEDDVRVNGYLTQHIVATSKDETKSDRYEFWVDQNTWLVVKSVQTLGNYTYEEEYNKFELNPKVDDSLFIVNIPEDADIQYLDNNLEKTNQEVTLDEAVKKLGTPVFYLQDEGFELIGSHYIESINEQYGRVELTYHTEDGSEFIVKSSPSSIVYEKLQLGYEKVMVGEIEASYIETGSAKYIEFIEDGTICDVYIKNSELSKEELIEIANRLSIKQ